MKSPIFNKFADALAFNDKHPTISGWESVPGGWQADIADHVISLIGSQLLQLDQDTFTWEFRSDSGKDIRFYSDDSSAPFWYVDNEYGLTAIIQARSESDAWDIYLDEYAWKVPKEDLHDAYGCDSNAEMETKVAQLPDGEYLDLIEGYHHMPNSSGSETGIVSCEGNEYPFPLTIETLRNRDIKMILKIEAK